MKIYFIEAEKDRLNPPTSDWQDYSTGKFICPSLALPTFAALTPSNFSTKIIDEKITDIDYYDLPDAVAITFKTMSCKRAYELSNEYRKRGAKVILGGIHASLLPDEAKENSDSVVVGEGEELWPLVISDLESNQLKPFYRMENLANLSKLPIPRFDLIENDRYCYHSVQTTRGCSLDCEFCPTREMFGGIFRTKPVKNVIREIAAVLEFGNKPIFFTDDIFGGGKKDYILALLKELKKLKIEFAVISDFLVLDKDIVVSLAKSGCTHMALNMPGTCTQPEVRAVKMIQALGIKIWGYFMFGFRFHEKDVFQKVYEFIHKTKLAYVTFTVMAPYPNTFAGKRFAEENRILTTDWSAYDQAQVVCIPEKMGVEEIQEGFQWIKSELGYMSKFYSERKTPLWRCFMNKALLAISGMLPMPSRNTSEIP